MRIPTFYPLPEMEDECPTAVSPPAADDRFPAPPPDEDFQEWRDELL